MITAGFSNDEQARIQELLKYNILDTPQEEDFEDVVKLASTVCSASIGLVTFIDDCRQWFKAKRGLTLTEVSKDISFCSYTLQHEGILVVEDLLADERFANNPLVVEEPKIRFYAGVPLVSPAGYKLGTLCVQDYTPRVLTENQLFALKVMAKYIVQLLELRLKKQNLANSRREHEVLRETMYQQERALTRAQRAARIGMFELSFQENRLKVSEGFCHLFGLKHASEMAAEQLTSLMHPEDFKGFQTYFKKSLEEGAKRFSYDYRCFKKNTKKEIFIKCTGEIVRNETGEAVKLIGVKQDITEQKWYEKQLEDQNAELIKVNQELDNFVYRVSHDLRAPISSLLGLVEVISGEEDLQEVKAMLKLAKKTLEKQDKFIKDILDYSRNARQQVQAEPIDFKEFLEEVFSQFAHAGQSERVDYSIDVQQQTSFETDVYRLRVVLNNLVSNSFKYLQQSREGSYVKVAVRVTEQQAVISVEDNGIGIQKEHHAKVFNMFYRATDHQPGSGLGLYIVKETINRLQGEVHMESVPGTGTTITLELPNLAR